MSLKTPLFAGLLFTLGVLLTHALPVDAAITNCSDSYYSFILTARSEATRKQSFSDFFSLGYCQLNDIMELEDQLDEIRDQFRETASSCGDTTEYRERYSEVLMEEYFVRNIQKSKSDVLNAVDEERLKALKQEKLDKLKAKMKTLFVDTEGRVDADTFDDYYANWSSKYDDRIANYAHCEEGAWAELQSTWQDFVEDINALDIDVKKNDSAMSFDVDTDVDLDTVDQPEMSGQGKATIDPSGYIDAKTEQQEAEVSARTSVQDLSEAGTPLTFEEALKTLNGSSIRFNIQTNAAERMGNYEVLYGVGGAVAATDMQSVLVYLNDTLQGSNAKDFPNIIKAANQIYGKQCQ